MARHKKKRHFSPEIRRLFFMYINTRHISHAEKFNNSLIYFKVIHW